MTTTAKGLPTTISGTATVLIRIAFFAATLAMAGAYFLPWAELDGLAESQSGAELTTLVISPTAQYLFAVNSLQTILLIGCPIAALLFSLLIVVNYAKGETHLFPAMVVLLVSIVFQTFTPNIVASDGTQFGFGNLLSIILSAVLLMHHLVIRLHTKLYQKRKYPSVFRRLYFLTGSGFYRSLADVSSIRSQSRSKGSRRR